MITKTSILTLIMMLSWLGVTLSDASLYLKVTASIVNILYIGYKYRLTKKREKPIKNVQ